MKARRKENSRVRVASRLAGLVLALLVAGSASAQDLEKLKNTTPEQRARLQTELMKASLGLAPEQLERVGALNLKYAQQMQPVITGSEGMLRKLAALQRIQESKEGELRVVLSDAQFEKYLAGREEMKRKFEEKLARKGAGGG